MLTKIIETFYGQDDICTSVHPIWAVTDKNVLYEFDILIKSKKIFIEYNGTQHYNYPNFFHSSKKQFKEQKDRDIKKCKIANDNGFSVVVFKYDEPMFKDYIINKIEGKIKWL